MNIISLDGIRIWISGAIPETPNPKNEAIIKFVSILTQKILSHNGCIVHGCHPSITPTIKEAASEYKRQTNNQTKKQILFCVSRHFETQYKDNLESWNEFATVLETPSINDSSNPRDESLKTMRDYLCARSDVIIAIGGEIWENFPSRTGVTAEINLAINSKLPCFILGGFGGSAEQLRNIIKDNHYKLKNGLDYEKNNQLANCEDPEECALTVLDQLSRLPLSTTTRTSTNTFRILCLDGGGIKGTYSASFLSSIEAHFKCNIIDYFDLIAGTSTGGIIALAIAAGIPASDILNFYKNKGETIFPTTRFINRWRYHFKHLFSAKHSINSLRSSLESAFNPTDSRTTTLHDLKCRVVIPTFHPLSGKSFIFRTPHCEIGLSQENISIIDVAVATAAAPTFFIPATLKQNGITNEYIDGGVWANTPSLVAIIEATKHLDIPLNKIDILSIGTTEEVQTFSKYKSGIINWARHLVSLLLHAQQESTIQLSKYLLGETRILRINHHVPAGKFSLDNADGINELASLGTTTANNDEIIRQIKSRFLNGVEAQKFDRTSLNFN